MTHSGSPYFTNSGTPKNKPPDPIITTSLSKSSSSTLSVSPSPSVLLSSSNRPSRNSSSGVGIRSSNMPQPSSSSSVSSSTTSSSSRNTKLEQIIQNFYTKTAQIIIQSRISNEKLKDIANTNSSSSRRKINKWFNITTNDYEHLKEELKFWKSLVKFHPEQEELPPLVIDIYLETTEPELLQEGDDIRGWHKLNLNIAQRILIESWTLTLNHPLPDFPVDLPNLYKRSIVFFRSLHSLVRLLPSHNLYRRLRVHDGEISLGYRISTKQAVNKNDEISLDRPLTNIDTVQLYEFKEVVTPLGTFKLKLLYRDHVQFDTREDQQSSVHGIDVEEYFFTPTMTKYRQEQSKESPRPSLTPLPPPTIHPATSSSSSSSRSNRVQSYRIIPSTRASHYPTTSTSTTTTSLERRISAPFVSPFKSPSLSSSPQAELMFTSSRSQTPENTKRPESGSFGRKIEFSSSFEKFKTTSTASSSNNSSSHNINRTNSNSNIVAPDMMRIWSRTSDHSSINLESEEDEEDLEEFMKFIGARQELKLFQQHASIYAERAPQQQQQQQQDDEEDSKKSLSHFRNIQEAHNTLSDSMSFSIHPSQQKQPQQQQQQHAFDSSAQNPTSSYESSSSSLTKGLNLPAIPSPLHNTESLLIHATAAATTSSTTAAATIAAEVPNMHVPSSSHHRRHNSDNISSLQQLSSEQQQQPISDEFFSYPRGQPHHPHFQQLTAHQAEIVAQSPLKNRQAPPLPPPPSAPTRGISGSTGLGDDDDSLVFKMSELSAGTYEEEGDDYLQRFKKMENVGGGATMRRINSSGNIPNTKTFMLDDIGAGHFSYDGTTTDSKQQPPQRQKLTHRLFYNDEE